MLVSEHMALKIYCWILILFHDEQRIVCILLIILNLTHKGFNDYSMFVQKQYSLLYVNFLIYTGLNLIIMLFRSLIIFTFKTWFKISESIFSKLPIIMLDFHYVGWDLIYLLDIFLGMHMLIFHYIFQFILPLMNMSFNPTMEI